MRPRLALALAALTAAGTARAQTAPAGAPGTPLSFGAFLTQVGRANLELAAQRTNLAIVDAQVTLARVFPDPVLTVGATSVDVSNVGAQNSMAVGVAIPIEWPARRPARIAAATTARFAAQAELEEFLRSLRGNAAGAFVQVLQAQLILDRRQRTLESLERLVAANEQRLRAGDVGEVALLQSRVEAQRFRSEVLAAEGELRAAELALTGFLATGAADTAGTPPGARGNLVVAPRTFNAEELIARAVAARPDVRARRAALEAAQARRDLAYANRGVDLTVNLGWQFFFPGAQGSAFQAPAYHTLGATLSVPLPFSRINRGEIDGASALIAQAQAQLRATELRVAVEVRQALSRYQAAAARVALFTGSVLADAERVLSSTLFSYQRGGATLLEVLNAQRTLNEAYMAYYDALADHARGLIAVQQAAGTWDVAF